MPGALAVARNLAKALLVLLGTCAAFGGAGWAAGGYRGLLLFTTAAVLLAATVYAYGDRLLLGMLGARELVAAEAPAVRSALGRLAARAGVPPPKLYLIPDGHPRLLTVGRGPGGASLAISRGLLAAAPPDELDGLLAHELAHVRSRDVLVHTIAVVAALTLVELSRVGGALGRALLFVLGPVAAAFVHALVSPKRELAADRAAAAIAGDPHGLADALLRLDRASELVELRASPATSPLLPVDPFAREGLAALFATHPPLEDRIRRLRALDPEWPERVAGV